MVQPTFFTMVLSGGLCFCLPMVDESQTRRISLHGPSLWQPSVGSSWQIVLSQKLEMESPRSSVTPDVDIFDIDMFSHLGTSTIANLHTLNRRVICYFSAGSYEPGRPDSVAFTPSILGFEMQGWPGEFWLDITSDAVRQIMTARIRLAAQIGCDAIDPDNIDGYQNDNGFELTAQHSIDFVKFLADEAAKYNMSIGLKNTLDIIPDVLSNVQFAVNEQCAQYGECAQVQPFIDAGKPVFHIEYTDVNQAERSDKNRSYDMIHTSRSRVSMAQSLDDGVSISCSSFKNVNGFSTVIKKLDLGSWVQICGGGITSFPT